MRDLIFKGLVHLFSMSKMHNEKCNLQYSIIEMDDL